MEDLSNQPTGPEEVDLGAPCRIEEIGSKGRIIKAAPCKYIGVITGRACASKIGKRNGEIVIRPPRKLIPCLERGESAAIKEELPLEGLILSPSKGGATLDEGDIAADFFPGEEDQTVQIYTSYVEPGDEDYRA